MSVYTELSRNDFETILADYELGKLRGFQGIAAGIENSNFFIDTQGEQGSGRYVLTIFERMEPSELPYFMRLMKHLSHHGLVCPDVMVRRDGSLLFDVHGKLGCIVSCLSGKTLDALNPAQLVAAGHVLAELHAAGADFPERRPSPTGYDWLTARATAMQADVEKRYGIAAASLLADELAWQGRQKLEGLPSGVIHGDLFVDNILFEGDAVSGVIDFYYAHDAAYAMDIAISLNALAVHLSADDTARMAAFLAGYETVRPLTEVEKAALPALLRRAALRFWVSRLYDALYPRGGAMTQTKDPEEYRQKLLLHREA
ncbi:MAG TPA: homoserine kinase [Mariprofundaceae bacterium]|nr:homoserine kinase [Mariprofundaceae bacterium]